MPLPRRSQSRVRRRSSTSCTPPSTSMPSTAWAYIDNRVDLVLASVVPGGVSRRPPHRAAPGPRRGILDRGEHQLVGDLAPRADAVQRLAQPPDKILCSLLME